MLEINGYQLRNLQEQVEKNKNDILAIINEQGTLNQFGIKVVGQIDILNNLPTVEVYKESNLNWEYGDAYAVGVTAPYSLYILTRAGGTHPNDYWFNIGQFPLQGAQGKDGTAATVEVAGTVTLVENSPARVENIGDKTNAELNFYIPRGEKGNTPTITIGTVESTTGNPEVTNSGTNTGAIFNFKLPKGEKGDKGDTGATGESFRIIATLDNTNQLPTPTESIRSNAYLIPDEENENHLWVITGDTTLLWTDAGQIQGVKGEQGPQGPAGTPGTNGTNGTAATVSIGSVTTLQPNASATVTNVGTPNNAILNFGIPKGVDGTGISAVGVTISSTSSAKSGTLTEEQVNTLQNNDSNYILFNNEKYDLMDKQHDSGYLTYSHVGQDSTHTFKIKSITITLNTRGWVLYEVTPQSKLTPKGNITIDADGNITGAYTHDINLIMKLKQVYKPSLAKMCFSVISKSKTPVKTLEQLKSLLERPTGINVRHIPASGWAYYPYDGNYLCYIDRLDVSISTGIEFIYNFIGKNAVLTNNEVTSSTFAPEIFLNNSRRPCEISESTIESITIEDTVTPNG